MGASACYAVTRALSPRAGDRFVMVLPVLGVHIIVHVWDVVRDDAHPTYNQGAEVFFDTDQRLASMPIREWRRFARRAVTAWQPAARTAAHGGAA